MAKLYHRNGALEGWRRDASEEAMFPIPADATVIEFDAETNVALAAALDTDWNSLSVVNGAVQRDGQPVAVQSDGAVLAERKAVTNAVQSLRDYRALASPSAAQTTAVVKLLCRVAIWILVDRLKVAA